MKGSNVYQYINVFEDSEGEYDDGDVIKQCFLLNLINLMTLVRLTEIIVLKHQSLQMIDSYPLWQDFMENNTIRVCGDEISQYHLVHSVLRASIDKLPTFGCLMQPKLIELNENLDKLKPARLIQNHFMGIFLPCKSVSC